MLGMDSISSRAEFTEEDLVKIRESEFFKQSNLETYDDRIEDVKEQYKECLNTEIETSNLFEAIEQINNKSSLCLIDKQENIVKLQNELSIKLMIETNLMIKQYFNQINHTLEETIKSAKKTDEYRKKYVSG